MNTTKDDKPPFSRVFVVCAKQTTEIDLLGPFEKYGEIWNVFIPRDRNTGESKGVAYIQYKKTSSAAAAIQNLNLKTIENINKPLKVMLATQKNENFNEDKCKRLFIKVPKDTTEKDITEHFSNFGVIDFVHMQKGKNQEVRGFAYVKYTTFLDAARAFEECDRRYKPVFATPKDEIMKNKLEVDTVHSSSHVNLKGNLYTDFYNQCGDTANRGSTSSLVKANPQGYNAVSVTCSPILHEKYIEKLFNVIPGVTGFQYSVDVFNGVCKATVTYDNERSVALAVERLHNFEFPSGELLSVKLDQNPLTKVANELTNIVKSFKTSLDSDNPNLIQLADAIARASTLIQTATTSRVDKADDARSICNVSLPPPQAMMDANTKVAQRCFIVCKPNPPPIPILNDVFSRFGDLINVSIIPNKIFGFAKYASSKAAKEAIMTLDGAIVCGSKLTVLEADEKNKDEGTKVDDCYTDHETKRIKLENDKN